MKIKQLTHKPLSIKQKIVWELYSKKNLMQYQIGEKLGLSQSQVALIIRRIKLKGYEKEVEEIKMRNFQHNANPLTKEQEAIAKELGLLDK